MNHRFAWLEEAVFASLLVVVSLSIHKCGSYKVQVMSRLESVVIPTSSIQRMEDADVSMSFESLSTRDIES